MAMNVVGALYASQKVCNAEVACIFVDDVPGIRRSDGQELGKHRTPCSQWNGKMPIMRHEQGEFKCTIPVI